MERTGNYICPICNEGTIEIISERTGPPGFRETDYYFGEINCDCITYQCENVAIAIKYSADKDTIKAAICQECNDEKATVHYPIRAWLGEYKDICPSCFRKEMEILEAEYGQK